MGLLVDNFIDVIPDNIERKGLLSQTIDKVSNALREGAYVGDAIPIPFIGDFGAAGLSLLATGCDLVAAYIDGDSWTDLGEIAVSGAAEAGVFAIPGDFIALDQITLAARHLGVEVADLPALGRYAASAAFNYVAGNTWDEGRSHSAVYKSKNQTDTSPETTQPQGELAVASQWTPPRF